uniref:Myelin P2 protein isoform X2 n=1 Tax=Castor canadensis TaxID=51338 RepID=A0A8B7VWZ9_CASCN|nr:myelin P2 protein isoform X2 [Castor canadensis]
MSNRFLGTWKLVSSEHFDDYMKALECCHPGERLTESCTEMGWQRDDHKEKVGRWENGSGKIVSNSQYRNNAI